MGSMKINYNATAMVTNNSLTRNDINLSESTKKLSSGLKINNAKDNPSGLAMANGTFVPAAASQRHSPGEPAVLPHDETGKAA